MSANTPLRAAVRKAHESAGLHIPEAPPAITRDEHDDHRVPPAWTRVRISPGSQIIRDDHTATVLQSPPDGLIAWVLDHELRSAVPTQPSA